jgi:hypothetical protein
MRLLDGASLNEPAAQRAISLSTLIAALKVHRVCGSMALDVARPGRHEGTGRTVTANQERKVQCLMRDSASD